MFFSTTYISTYIISWTSLEIYREKYTHILAHRFPFCLHLKSNAYVFHDARHTTPHRTNRPTVPLPTRSFVFLLSAKEKIRDISKYRARHAIMRAHTPNTLCRKSVLHPTNKWERIECSTVSCRRNFQEKLSPCAFGAQAPEHSAFLVHVYNVSASVCVCTTRIISENYCLWKSPSVPYICIYSVICGYIYVTSHGWKWSVNRLWICMRVSCLQSCVFLIECELFFSCWRCH